MLVLDWTILYGTDEAMDETSVVVKLPLQNSWYIQDPAPHRFRFLGHFSGYLALVVEARTAHVGARQLQP